MDWGIAAGIVAGILTPAVGWLLARVVSYGERVTALERMVSSMSAAVDGAAGRGERLTAVERDLSALDSVVRGQVGELKDQLSSLRSEIRGDLKVMRDELQRHMEQEVGQIEAALRRVISESRADR